MYKFKCIKMYKRPYVCAVGRAGASAGPTGQIPSWLRGGRMGTLTQENKALEVLHGNMRHHQVNAGNFGLLLYRQLLFFVFFSLESG